MRSAFRNTLLLFFALQITAVDVAAGLAPPSLVTPLSYKMEKPPPLTVVLAARAETEADEVSKEKERPAPVFDFALQAKCLSANLAISSYPPTPSSLQHCRPGPVLLCSLLI